MISKQILQVGILIPFFTLTSGYNLLKNYSPEQTNNISNVQKLKQQETKKTPGHSLLESLLGCGQPPKLDLSPQKIDVNPLVSIKVSPNGSVTTAKIVRSSGFTKLDKVAVDWVRNCRFTESPNARTGKIRVNLIQSDS